MNITLKRIGSTPWGTLGRLTTESGFECVTMEREWAGNKSKKSCIPAGDYLLKQRNSAIVYRTTKGKHSKGWEVTAVPGRSFIMIHPGNWQTDLEGCIAPGRVFSILQGKPAVVHSLLAFNDLMRELSGSEQHKLRIVWEDPEV